MTTARILIVEDETIVARDLGQQLVELGYEIVGTCTNGEEALQLADRLRPDLMLMDIQLDGEMDGITAATLVRERFAVPVIFLTAFTGGETVSRAKLAEPYGYIIKPFDERELRTVVELGIYKHQVESRLRESEERFRALFESSMDGMMLAAPDGVVLAANPAACTMLGRTEGEICRLGLDALVETNDPGLPVLLAARQLHGKVRGELTMIRADGTRFEVEISSAVFAAAAGKRAGLVIRDITERRLADEKLRKLSRLIEQAPLSVIITDLNGVIEYVNPKFCALTGYTSQEVVGKNPRVLKSGQTPPDVYRDMWQTLARGEVWSGELRNRKKNGEYFLETAVIAPVVNETGTATHFVALKEDVTAQKRFVAETTALLEKERQVSEMKTRFISVTSHEFRTPMSAALGSAELLQNHFDRLSPQKRDELLGRIGASLRRMTEMLDDVLTLNRMDANRTEVRLHPIELRTYLLDVVEEIRLGDHEAHRFDVQVAGDTTGFVTDTHLLHHILSNLLSNAVRYSPAGTLINVRLDAGATQARLVVEDHGIGIPPADCARIFEPFERGSNVGNIKGTGLGLNIVKRMTTLLGGTIAVEPVADGGTRFLVDFPRLASPGPAP